MIEFVLIFLLGFCCAAFLALLVAPTVWRRAVSLTRERIEATVPLTVGEVRAEKDRLRAEHAMEVRRIEIELKAEREKAARRTAEIARNQEAIRRLTEDLERSVVHTDEQQAVHEDHQDELQARDEEIGRLSRQLAEAETLSQQHRLEVDRLGRMFEEASLETSNRQIELAARDSEIAGLETELASLRSKRKELERRVADAEAALKSAEATLQVEQERADGLERRNERLLSTTSDLEDKMERKEREIAGRSDASAPGVAAAGQGRPNGTEHLEERLARILKDKDRLQEEITALGAETLSDSKAQKAEEAHLRDRIGGVAAEIVHLAAQLDGADSPIHELLAKADSSGKGNGVPGVPSLAERVRALDEVDASGTGSGA